MIHLRVSCLGDHISYRVGVSSQSVYTCLRPYVPHLGKEEGGRGGRGGEGGREGRRGEGRGGREEREGGRKGGKEGREVREGREEGRMEDITVWEKQDSWSDSPWLKHLFLL